MLADVVVTETVVEFITVVDSVMATVVVVVFVPQMVSVAVSVVICATEEELCESATFVV